MQPMRNHELTGIIYERHHQIVAALAAYIARPDQDTPGDGHVKAATALLDATLAALVSGNALSSHLPANVDKRYLSRFGDGLLPILRDAIDADIPDSLLSRTGDAYWQAISQVTV